MTQNSPFPPLPFPSPSSLPPLPGCLGRAPSGGGPGCPNKRINWSRIWYVHSGAFFVSKRQHIQCFTFCEQKLIQWCGCLNRGALRHTTVSDSTTFKPKTIPSLPFSLSLPPSPSPFRPLPLPSLVLPPLPSRPLRSRPPYIHHHRRLWTQANASKSASLATCN